MIYRLAKSLERSVPWHHAGMIGLIAILSWFVDSGPVLRLLLTLFALAAVVYASSARVSLQHKLLIVGAITAMLVVGIKDDVANVIDGNVRVSNVYHYYMGSKYFEELGYTDLYVATLAADRAGDNYWTGKINRVRNLKNYEIQSVDQALAAWNPHEHFSADRWLEFKRDVAAWQKHRSAKDWREIFRDRGYNGTPVWTAMGQVLTAMISTGGAGPLLLCSLDILLLIAAGVLLSRAFGAQLALFVCLLFVASPANIARAVGGFLQFDWLFAIVASVCLLKGDRPGSAGVAIAYAIMTRAFPALLVVSLCVAALAGWISDRRMPRHAIRFAAGVTGACAVIALLSLGNGHGMQAWFEFLDAILLHDGDHVLGQRRIGLEHVFTANVTSFGMELDKLARAEILASQQIYFLGSACALLGLWCMAIYRSAPLNALLLGMIPIFTFAVLSRYYFALLALLPLLIVSRHQAVKWIVIGQLVVFLGQRLADVVGLDWHGQYVVFNVMLALYFSGLLLLLLRLREHVAERATEVIRAQRQSNSIFPASMSGVESARAGLEAGNSKIIRTQTAARVSDQVVFPNA